MENIHSSIIVGAGAIGASIAARLSDAGRPVAVCAEGERAARYEKEGFVVNGARHFLPVMGSRSAKPVDLIVLAVKNYDLEATIGAMSPFIGEETTIVSLLNGVDAVPRLRKAFGADSVPYGMIIGIDAHRAGNEINYMAKGQIFCGYEANLARANAARLARVERFFSGADIIFRVPEDIVREIWYKFMINVSINQWSAILGAPYRLFQTSTHAEALLRGTMAEVIALSKRLGTGLVESDAAKAMAVLRTLAPEGKTSMLQDVEAKRKTEVEAFAGAMERLAADAGMTVPINAMLSEAIHAIEDSYGLYKAK